MSELMLDRNIRDIATALRDGSTSAEALAEQSIDRHDANGDALEAYIHWDSAGAIAQARAVDAALKAGYEPGPLAGIPVSLKDLYGVRNMPTYGGGPTELPGDWRREGPVTRALRGAMCVVPGKTHTVEFAFGAVGTNAHWGAPRNPWDAGRHRVSGGSSSGAGVSLCEGSALIAMGTDTGGSVRIPASVTGNVGLKVTIGRWSIDGIVPLAPTWDTPGPLARTVEDAAIAFGTIDPAVDNTLGFVDGLHGREASELCLGMCDEHFWDDCSPGIAEAVRGAIDELTAKGARLKKVSMDMATEARDSTHRGGIFGAEGWAWLQAGYPERAATLDPNIAARFEVGRALPASDYYQAIHGIKPMAAGANHALRHVDALVVPMVNGTPPTAEAVSDDAIYREQVVKITRNAHPVNLLELCAITLPVGLDAAGMPVGLQLIGRGGTEERLLSTALAVEAVLGTSAARLGRPPLIRR
ncbi:MAG: amidase [Alphaproteobacteria bacterium]|jgi:aspartyl-tRNA(Asn)/glutamyl-tRNA(Gln) amidotransferase subunit A|nr:amidase [Alphaproteobacteria bacterium]